MTTITIPITDEGLARLQDLAAQAGLAPEEFLGQRVSKLLQLPDDAFAEAAERVFQKNAELYRRLS